MAIAIVKVIIIAMPVSATAPVSCLPYHSSNPNHFSNLRFMIMIFVISNVMSCLPLTSVGVCSGLAASIHGANRTRRRRRRRRISKKKKMMMKLIIRIVLSIEC